MSYSAGYSDMEPREIVLTERHREALAAFLKTAELRLEPDLEVLQTVCVLILIDHNIVRLVARDPLPVPALVFSGPIQ